MRTGTALLALVLLAGSAAGRVRANAAPAPEPGSPAAVRAAADLVEELRGLRFKQPVRIVRLGAVEAQRSLAREMDEALTPEQYEDLTALLAELELLPRGFPLRERLLALASEQVAGFYEPGAKEFFIVEPGPELARAVEARAGRDAAAAIYDTVVPHELAHALVDQHFDLVRLLEDPALREREDAVFARHALAEGDATLVMLLAGLKQLNVEPTPAAVPGAEALRQLASRGGLGFTELDDAPPFLRLQLMEPYLLGLELVSRAWRSGGWSAVNAEWRLPPESTEQLLHPERRNDAPRTIPPEPVPPGWTLRHHADLGELGLRAWLATRLPEADAARAGAGWDGDRALLLERPFTPAPGDVQRYPERERAVLLRSAWDTNEDAAEFAGAAERWLFAALPGERDEWTVRRHGSAVEVFLHRALEGELPVEPLDRDPWERPPSDLRPADSETAR